MNISEIHRARRQKLLLRRIILAFLLFLFLCALIWGFFWISFFRIKSVEISGTIDTGKTNTITREYLNGLNKFFLPKNNFFLLNTDEIIQLIKDKNLGVAIVEKNFPSALSVVFPEREARFIICASNDTCYYISEDGLIYSEAPQFSEYPLPLIVVAQNGSSSLEKSYSIAIGDQLAGSSTVRFLNTMAQELPKIGIENKIIEIKTEYGDSAPFDFKEIKIFTPKEWYLYLNTQMKPETVLNNIKLLFEQKIKENRDKLQYIDMRFENKVFYMLY